MKTLEELKLDTQFLTAMNEALDLVSPPMNEMLRYHFGGGGKHLRPLLAISAGAAFLDRSKLSGTDKILPFAVAVEIIHNGTLIHDDIQDEDRVRRNIDTLWVKYSIAQGINCGNACYFLAPILVQNSNYSPEVKSWLIDLIQRETLKVVEGQAQEFALKEKFKAGEKILTADYLRMVDGKTSALFALPLLGGAKIVGASDGDLTGLRKIALHLGRAFQIQDDLLDLWGNKGRKQRGSDIAEGKISYPVMKILEQLDERDVSFKWLQKAIVTPRSETTEDDIAWVISLLDRNGIKELVEQDFHVQLQEAKQISEWRALTDLWVSYLEEKIRF